MNSTPTASKVRRVCDCPRLAIEQGSLALSLLPLSQPDPWATPVLVDEFDARCLKGFRQRRHSGCTRDKYAGLGFKRVSSTTEKVCGLFN
jgi:hypothetical protein